MFSSLKSFVDMYLMSVGEDNVWSWYLDIQYLNQFESQF